MPDLSSKATTAHTNGNKRQLDNNVKEPVLRDKS